MSWPAASALLSAMHLDPLDVTLASSMCRSRAVGLSGEWLDPVLMQAGMMLPSAMVQKLLGRAQVLGSCPRAAASPSVAYTGIFSAVIALCGPYANVWSEPATPGRLAVFTLMAAMLHTAALVLDDRKSEPGRIARLAAGNGHLGSMVLAAIMGMHDAVSFAFCATVMIAATFMPNLARHALSAAVMSCLGVMLVAAS